MGVIEQSAEQRFGVEPRDAQPGNRTVNTDQGSGGSVPDQPVVFERKVTVGASDRPKRRIRILHVTSSIAHTAKRQRFSSEADQHFHDIVEFLVRHLERSFHVVECKLMCRHGCRIDPAGLQ
ncbi:hypothetical protein [Nocardia sp. NPDC047038]|uniref:hypothetical protein n=1 Tax=Nocardia sp. NPDC047038 TaxID=3154338 RepID=UPI0033C7CA6E